MSRRWTREEVALAEALVARDASDDECMAAIGRNRNACYVKLMRWPDQQGKTFRMPRLAPQEKAPDHVFEDRNRRLMAPRDLTGTFFGDPPKGFSALERRP